MPSAPDLDLLATFLAAYRAGSLTSAAARLGLSQPSVSDRIARLEHAVGATLFTRTARGVAPTAEADRLVARIAEPVDRLAAVLAAPEDAAIGTVRVGAASDLVAQRLVPALAPLARDGVRLEFTLGLADDLLERLATGMLDVVVSAVRPRHPGVRSRGLVDEEFVLVGSPALAATVDPARLREDPAAALGHLPLVAYDDGPAIIRRYWRSEFATRPRNTVALVVPDLRAVLAAVAAGVGISALPRYLAEPAILAGTVQVLHTSPAPPINTLHLAVPTSEPSPAAVRVLDRLSEQAAAWNLL